MNNPLILKHNKYKVLDRDYNTCQNCFSTKSLEVHHIIPMRENGSDELDNLITLCVKCHRRIDAKLRPHISDDMKKQLIIEVDEKLHSKLKIEAIKQNKSLKQLVTEMLEN